MAPRPLLIALHGSPHPGSAVFGDELAAAVASRLGDVSVAPAWVDRRVRTIDAALAEVREAVVVPAFLTAGYHVGLDVPDAAALVRGVTITGHVGPALLGAVADRVREAGGPGDAILVAAAGSNRPEALAELERAASGLGRLFGVEARVGSCYGDGESLESVASGLAADGFADVTVASFFLAPGLWEGRLSGLVEAGSVARVSGPVGVHPDLVDAIVGLYRAAAEPASPYLTGLHLAGRRVLVAGAGAVASRRLPALLAAGASVCVVAPEASGEIRALAAVGDLTWERRRAEASDVAGAWFVVAATADPETNRALAEAAEAAHTFCVRADAATAGSARTPASGRAAGLIVGVLSASGRAPALAAAARDVAVASVEAWAAPIAELPASDRGAA